MKYAVCEIKGKQYIVRPKQEIEVGKLNNDKALTVDRVLLFVDDKKIQIGTPYLQHTLQFQILGNVKKDKIRVAKFHAKANYRKVLGFRAEMTKIKLISV